MHIRIPYDNEEKVIALEDQRVRSVLFSKTDEFTSGESPSKLVGDALGHPIGTSKLRDLAVGAKRILMITSDHTRPVPSLVTLPILLQELRSRNPGAEIRILVATGCHRAPTHQEMVDKFGRVLLAKEQFVIHDSADEEQMVYKGILPSGGELWLNGALDWADLVVSEGFIEPHFFAGYSGGRKSILPGIAGKKTVYANHCAKFIDSPQARTGILEGNPIHADMVYAADEANLAFILNVVLNGQKEIVKAFAGDPHLAHSEGCAYIGELAAIKAVPADIVITSNGGYPLDQNIYQAVKGMTAAEACVNPGGIIIMAAACRDGHGGEDFYRWFRDAEAPDTVMETILSTPQMYTKPDQWQAQILARILKHCTVIMVSDPQNQDIIEEMHLRYAQDMESALRLADSILGYEAQIVVIPDGVGVIIESK